MIFLNPNLWQNLPGTPRMGRSRAVARLHVQRRMGPPGTPRSLLRRETLPDIQELLGYHQQPARLYADKHAQNTIN